MIVASLRVLVVITLGSISQASHSNVSVSAPALRGGDPHPKCTTVKGPVRLRSNSWSPCQVKRLNVKALQLKNSANTPLLHPDGVTCEGSLSTAAPRYLEISPVLFQFEKSDRLVIKGPFGYKEVIKKMNPGPTIFAPSSFTIVYFKTKFKKRKAFRLKVVAKTNSCQRVCKLRQGSIGVIRQRSYDPNTYCEWWLEAPEDCKIHLKFVTFNVGDGGSKGAWACTGDYVGVDRGGDPTYAHPNSRTFCGSTLPNGIRSIANKLNVLFNGREGGLQGFRAIYKVSCPSDITENHGVTQITDEPTVNELTVAPAISDITVDDVLSTSEIISETGGPVMTEEYITTDQTSTSAGHNSTTDISSTEGKMTTGKSISTASGYVSTTGVSTADEAFQTSKGYITTVNEISWTDGSHSTTDTSRTDEASRTTIGFITTAKETSTTDGYFSTAGVITTEEASTTSKVYTTTAKEISSTIGSPSTAGVITTEAASTTSTGYISTPKQSTTDGSLLTSKSLTTETRNTPTTLDTTNQSTPNHLNTTTIFDGSVTTGSSSKYTTAGEGHKSTTVTPIVTSSEIMTTEISTISGTTDNRDEKVRSSTTTTVNMDENTSTEKKTTLPTVSQSLPDGQSTTEQIDTPAVTDLLQVNPGSTTDITITLELPPPPLNIETQDIFVDEDDGWNDESWPEEWDEGWEEGDYDEGQWEYDYGDFYVTEDYENYEDYEYVDEEYRH